MNATLKIHKQTPRSAPETGEQIVDHWRIAPRVIVGTHCPAQQGLPEMRALKGPMTRLNSDRGSQPVDKARLDILNCKAAPPLSGWTRRAFISLLGGARPVAARGV